MRRNWRLDTDSESDEEEQITQIKEKHNDASSGGDVVCDIVKETREVSSASVDSTKRSLQMISQMNDMSDTICTQLESQSSQLNRIDTDLDTMGTKLSEAKTEIRKLGRGMIRGLADTIRFSRKQPVKPEKPETQCHPETSVERNETTLSPKNTAPKKSVFDTSVRRSWHTDKVVNQTMDETSRNLDKISEGLQKLSEKSIQIGCELDMQGKQIAKVNEKTDTANENMKDVSDKLKKCIK